jgi:hypothetical protein
MYLHHISLQCDRSTSGDKQLQVNYNIKWKKAVRCYNTTETVEKLMLSAYGDNPS